ncbi:lamin tail domain-containing protein [Thermomonospora umbrina]|uniref:Lamin tail-like protein n=1 Tax=Thermomonospora umbrina TaxID=111806 RepID=A0A3D9STU8_9ACTN|nr:lamin tail domain-containing protein [Thermomonospora umbrina]REE97443.1 lamin tail-like protein [Thermomonospora umbrina]
MRTRLISTAVAAGAAAAVVLAPTAAEAAGAIQIYRVYYDSPGKDTGSNSSLNAEWVQIKNKGSKARQLKNWRLRDKNGFVYTFGTFTLRAGATVTVRTGKGSNTSKTRYWGRSWYVWNNTGDTAYLRFPNGSLADSCSWGSKGDWKYC